MTEMNVHELIALIYSVETEGYEEKEEFKKNLLENLDFEGGNQHLHSPPNHSSIASNFNFQDRGVPLTGEEKIYGDFLLYDPLGIGRAGTKTVILCHSLEEIEKHILSPGNLKHNFSLDMIPIVFGKVKNYTVHLAWMD